MKIKIFEFEFHDGLYISFQNIKSINRIVNIIKKNKIAELLNSVAGICSIIKLYKTGDFEFHLIHHEDIEICLRLPVKRDRKNYDLLREIGKKIAQA